MAEFQAQVVTFYCQHYGLNGLVQAAGQRLEIPAEVKMVSVPCSGKVDVRLILEAFEQGADAVYVAGCLEGDCYYRLGNLRARKRVEYLERLLEDIGIGSERIEMFNLSGSLGESFAEAARRIVARAYELGPSPVKRPVAG